MFKFARMLSSLLGVFMLVWFTSPVQAQETKASCAVYVFISRSKNFTRVGVDLQSPQDAFASTDDGLTWFKIAYHPARTSLTINGHATGHVWVSLDGSRRTSCFDYSWNLPLDERPVKITSVKTDNFVTLEGEGFLQDGDNPPRILYSLNGQEYVLSQPGSGHGAWRDELISFPMYPADKYFLEVGTQRMEIILPSVPQAFLPLIGRGFIR